MKRKILIKVSGEARSLSPAERLWAGMQYEDNATEVVFDLSAIDTEKALYRIDFNSVTAGYFPGENLSPDSMPSIRRSIPKYLTQYGGELEAVAVITPLDNADEPTGEVLSYPVKLYFTEVSRGDEGGAEFIPPLSAMEEEVRRAVREADELVSTVEKRLENGEFKGEKGDRGEKGEAGRDAAIDQNYNPESDNAQSGKAVAEAVDTKANLEYKDLPTDIFGQPEVGTEGTGVYILNEFYPVLTAMEGTVYSLVFGNSDVRLPSNGLVSSPRYFEEIGFIIGRKYEIKMSIDAYGDPTVLDSVRAIIDLEDKVNTTDFEEALANLGGGSVGSWELLEDISLTEEASAVNLSVEKMNTKKEVHIEGYIVPTDTTVTGQQFMFNDGASIWQANANCKATGKIYLVMDIYKSPRNRPVFDGTVSAYTYTLSGGSFKTTRYDAELSDAETDSLINSSSLSFRTSATNPMAAGTKIKVWGR